MDKFNKGKFEKGCIPWNKDKKGVQTSWNKGIKGICKPNSGSFEKGSVPWNKNLKGYMGANKTSFKKGHKINYIDNRSKLVAPGRYGDDWDKIRYLVYLRDRFTCQHCGIQGIRLDIHHKIPFLMSFDNSLNNLITLCRNCHMKEEHKIRREQELNTERMILC